MRWTPEMVTHLMAQVAMLLMVASGFLIMFGARRLAGRVILLALFLAGVSAFVGPSWLPG